MGQCRSIKGMRPRLWIAIDGPAGSGKSTVARMLARRLGLLHVDTGAMYRALTLKALREGVDLQDEEALVELARRTHITLTPACSGGGVRVFLEGEDVTEAVRSPEVSRSVSLVARVPGVRELMVRWQREMAAQWGGVVMEGRDVGTVILPDAQLKVFLTASPEERARRRQQDLLAQGYRVDLERLVQEISERDRLDRSRPVAPLVPAPDAWVIDSSGLTAEEVVEMITARVLGG